MFEGIAEQPTVPFDVSGRGDSGLSYSGRNVISCRPGEKRRQSICEGALVTVSTDGKKAARPRDFSDFKRAISTQIRLLFASATEPLLRSSV